MADKEPKPVVVPAPSPPSASGTQAGKSAEKPPDKDKSKDPSDKGDVLKDPTPKNDVPAYIAEENKKQTNDLAQAKDRAQLTATSAMSVVYIALLKELLVAGPEKARYFTLSMALVTACILLQVIAGIISLVISHRQASFAELKGNACEDVLSNLCCCKLRFRKGKKQDKHPHGKDSGTSEDVSIDTQPRPALVSLPSTLSRSEDTESQAGEDPCCPCYISTDLYPEKELDVIERYDQWCEEQLDIVIQAEEAQVHLSHLTQVIADAKDKLAKLESSGEAETEDGEEQAREIKALLKNAEHWKKTYQDYLWNRDMSEETGLVLWKQSSEIQEYNMLKTNTFWQQILNYIFYIVFVLNVFITGLGISEKQTNSNSGLNAFTSAVPGVTVTPTNAAGNATI